MVFFFLGGGTVQVTISHDLPKGHKAADSPQDTLEKIKKRPSFVQSDLAPTWEPVLENSAWNELQFLLTGQLATLLLRAQPRQLCQGRPVFMCKPWVYYICGAIQSNKVSIWGTAHGVQHMGH